MAVAMQAASFKRNLARSRRAPVASRNARSRVARARKGMETAKQVASMATKVKAIDVPIYGFCLFLALFKDIILDFVGLGTFPVIGAVVTLCISSLMAAVLFFDGSNSGARSLAKKIVALIVGGSIEGLAIGVNFLPIETITIVIIYLITLASREE
ncbi:hypothetical protein ACFL2R_01720 [Patescibacteria group bacterium]